MPESEPNAQSLLLKAIAPDDLQKAITHIVGKPVGPIGDIESQEPPAGCAGYVCPKEFIRVGWKAGTEQGKVSVVAKWFRGGGGEAYVYNLLAGRDDLAPRAYACRHRETNEEILILERLPFTGVNPNDPMAVAAYLRSLGRLNAVNPGNVLPVLNCREKIEYGLYKLPQLLEECRAQMHGEALTAEAANWPADEAVIRRGMETCLGVIETCPLGLLHFDPAPQNCGRRSETDDFVFFDLHGALKGPVVADIARWSAPADCTEAVRASRIEIWNESLRAAGGPVLSSEQVRIWSDAIQPVRISGVLGWFRNRLHDGKADFTDDTEVAKAAFRGWTCAMLVCIRRCIMNKTAT
jgi:hypothetical protein